MFFGPVETPKPGVPGDSGLGFNDEGSRCAYENEIRGKIKRKEILS